jgi:predicted Fe-Mo cluster-binding NifX family protein
MKVCIPVEQDCGLDSLVSGHFGSAPMFVLVDCDTMSVESLNNGDQDHVHGQCSPVRALAGANPDAVVVGGIGAGAIRGLRAAGIRVYGCAGGTVAEVVQQLKAGSLPEMNEDAACRGHAGGHTCH